MKARKPNRVWRAPSSSERAAVGVVVCCLAAIPLSIGYSLYGYATSNEPWPTIYIVVGTAAIVTYACMITGFSAVCFGVPIYLLSARLKMLRPLVLLVAATLSGVVVHETWNGVSLFEDLEGTLLFAFFGLYSGAAFWFGADVLVRGKSPSRNPREAVCGNE